MHKGFFEAPPRKRYSPEDETKYLVPTKAFEYSENILKEYGAIEPSNEGMVYWAGLKAGHEIRVKCVVAPKLETMWGRVDVSHDSNAQYVKKLYRMGLVHVAQVHTHPGEWVDHSYGDDKMAAFKSVGLVSIVVPCYGQRGMSPLTICGVHRYEEEEFIRLSDGYVENHFLFDNAMSCIFSDLRK